MRTFARIFALMAVLAFAAGPAWAAPFLHSPGAAFSAPHPATHPASPWDLLPVAGPVAFGITMRKDAGAIAAKFVTRAQNSVKDYQDGVAGAGAEWEANTKGSEAAYEQGVQEAIGRKAFGKGVSEAGASKYQTNAVKLGGTRFGPGVANAQEAYVRGVGPYLDVLRNLVLPPKGPRRSPQNQQRANAVALALGNRRVNS